VSVLGSCQFSKHLVQYEMKAFPGVTDSEWFALLSQQPEIDVVTFLPKTARQKDRG